MIPILAAVICVYLMLNLSLETWLRFAIWMALGFVVYAVYGYRRSRVGDRGEDRRGHQGLASAAAGRAPDPVRGRGLCRR